MQNIKEIFVSLKTAIGTAGATIIAGLGSLVELIPTDIGKVASLVGVVVTLFLAYLQWKRSKREDAEHKLQMEQLALENETMRRQLDN